MTRPCDVEYPDEGYRLDLGVGWPDGYEWCDSACLRGRSGAWLTYAQWQAHVLDRTDCGGVPGDAKRGEPSARVLSRPKVSDAEFPGWWAARRLFLPSRRALP